MKHFRHVKQKWKPLLESVNIQSKKIRTKKILLLICLFVFILNKPQIFAQEILTSGKILTFTFPELPPALHAMVKSKSEPPTISVQLPDNYTPDRPFPLLVFLNGGNGSDGTDLKTPMAIIGKSDFIIANFPLFKKEKPDPGDPWVHVGFDDYPTISHAYKVFMDRIRETIPNMDVQTSVIGGFSRGAHTLAVLLSAVDPNILKSFHGFYFIDGGTEWTSYSHIQALKNHHILYVVGGGTPGELWWRKSTLSRVEYFKVLAEKYGMSKWNFVVLDGLEHKQSPEYFLKVREWAVVIKTKEESVK